MKRFLWRTFTVGIELVMLPIVVIAALVSRLVPKKIDVGLGPEPLINNVYHKRALKLFGYTAETFVSSVYYITQEFDVRVDKLFQKLPRFLHFTATYYLFFWIIFRYRALYLYFNGGPLGLNTRVLRLIEPLLYRLANVKTIVMPYGGDVQDLSRSPNLLFKHAVARDYPRFRLQRARIIQQIDLWTTYANHVISGCDWVDYMYHWDTLMLGHFSIDTEYWQPRLEAAAPDPVGSRKVRVLHAPNHRSIKGTQFFIQAINELIAEGLDLELIILERVPNHQVKEVMASVDIVADQLIIGWYAMFALEAMALEKVVLCYLRPDLEELYVAAGLVALNEIPIIHCSLSTVKQRIRELVLNREQLREIGRRSRNFVSKHHSTQAVGQVFDQINRSLQVTPSGAITKLPAAERTPSAKPVAN